MPKQAIAIPVKSKDDPKGKTSKRPENEKDNAEEPELSVEDQRLKDRLEELVATCLDPSVNAEVQRNALRMLGQDIREATCSMTSVPKPLKFLSPHYDGLVEAFNALSPTSACRKDFADILSVLSMTMSPMARYEVKCAMLESSREKKRKKKEEEEKQKGSSSSNVTKKDATDAAKKDTTASSADPSPSPTDTNASTNKDKKDDTEEEEELVEPEDERRVLNYKLIGNVSKKDVESWGAEYMRSLGGEIGREYESRLAAVENTENDETSPDMDDLMTLVDIIVPYHMAHNSSAEAVDLLLEVGELAKVLKLPLLDHETSSRVALYILHLADFMGDDPEEHRATLRVAYELYRRQGEAAQKTVNLPDQNNGESINEKAKEEWITQMRAMASTCDALRVALRLGDFDAARMLFVRAKGNDALRRQIAHILAEMRAFDVVLSSDHYWKTQSEDENDNEMDDDDNDDEEDLDDYDEIIGNAHLSEHFIKLARELDVMEPKVPEDVYKSAISGSVSTMMAEEDSGRVESARKNLADTIVNAFVNAGFKADKLMTKKPASTEGASTASSSSSTSTADNNRAALSDWISHNKNCGKISAAASLGLIHLWDADEGMSQCDKFMYSNDPAVVTGGLLGSCVVMSGVRDSNMMVKAIVEDYVFSKEDKDGRKAIPVERRMAAVLGLGIAYAGCANNPEEEAVLAMLTRYLDPTDEEMWHGVELASYAALALGLVYVGAAAHESNPAELLFNNVMLMSETDLSQPITKLLSVGFGLIYLGCGMDAAEAIIECLRLLPDASMAKYAELTVRTCANAGSGNVMAIQEMLHICAEHLKDPEEENEDAENEDNLPHDGSGESEQKNTDAAETEGKEKEKEKTAHPIYQSVAVLGMALIGMTERVGREMLLRAFDHLLQYSTSPVKRAVPLAIAMMHISNPDTNPMDTLSKLTHDNNKHVARAAILALGFMSAGTNNARCAQMLRLLMSYYNDADMKFVIRIAHGLVHMGKGLVTMSPLQSDHFITHKAGLGALIALMHLSFDMSKTLLGKKHHMLFFALACAMRPRMVMTLDEDGEELETQVRVGRAVETVGQAGKPKRITGFQQHSTPVLLGNTDRAVMANDEYVALTNVLEGVVIVKENIDSDHRRNVAAEEKRKKKRSDLEHQSRAAAHTKLYKSKRKTSGSK